MKLKLTTVDYSTKQLKEIPIDEISPETNWAILSYNRITEIKNNICKLQKLTRLALNDNKITQINYNIGFCLHINWIDLTRNKLKELPKEFGRLTKITGLGLSENKFDKIPECIYKLKNLRKFGFFSNNINYISPDIKYLTNLIKIDLSNNQITEIPIEMMDLINLNWLNLSNNKIKKIPNEINNLKRLEELGLGMNKIEEIPDMSKLNSLRIFPVFKNRIKKIHKSIFFLRSLEKLDLSDNLIEEFPYEAINSTVNNKVHFNNPNITKWDKNLDRNLDKNPLIKNQGLSKLKYLNLRGNEIKEIHSSLIDFNTNCQITMIDLSENKLNNIPFRLFNIFLPTSNIRLNNNPYVLEKLKFPTNVSLTEICISNILKKNKELDPWVDKFYSQKYYCDGCETKFVSTPIFFYLESFFDSDSKFVVKKTLCGKSCVYKHIQ